MEHQTNRQLGKVGQMHFGLSTMHIRIRSLEYVLHIAYNLDFKDYYAKTQAQKEQKAKRKKYIQTMLKIKLWITVDVVKQDSRTTNTGNVSRIFFANSRIAAKVTKIDEGLIKRFNNILPVITCSQNVNCEKNRCQFIGP